MTSLRNTSADRQADSRLSGDNNTLSANYLNWNTSAHSLEFLSRSHELFSHQLQHSTQLVIGLCGEDKYALLDANQQAVAPLNPIHRNQTSTDGLHPDTLLASQCSAIMLKRHCDKIIMSTALVKNRGEMQLFLATDFIRWDDTETGTTHLAPLVLYPVQLFYNDHSDDDIDNFLLFSGTDAAVENKPLVEKLNKELGISLPVLDNKNQQEFILSAVVALQAYPAYSLCKRIQLNVLPTGPENYGALLAKRYRRAADRQLNKPFALGLLKNRSIPELHSLLDVLEHDRDSLFGTEQPDNVLDEKLKQLASSLSSFALGGLTLRHVMTLPEKIEHWALAIENLRDSVLMKELASDNPVFYAGLADSLALIETPPSENAGYYHPDHAYKNTLATLQRAKFQCRLIVAELDALKSVFNLESVPELHELQSLCEILDHHAQSTAAVVETDYFHARRKLSSLLCSGSNIYSQTEELQLKRLIKILRLRELFSNNNEYRLAFGKLFIGMRTEWTLLESHIVFAGRIANHTGSEALTAHLLKHWNSLSFAILEAAPEIHIAARAIRRLLQLLQIPPGNEPGLDELLAMARQLKPRLEEIRNQSLPRGNVEGLSSQGILDVMDLLDATRRHDQSALSDAERESFRTSVLATLEWLKNALCQDNIQIQDLELLVKRVPA
ncbi:MAG: DUF4011 domain-containing protein [Gammaproteobacteria bacterium]|nr:DUF4011 domain-containing protein [Gammaproteobacteria bacterium]